jgi:hypothetical protein
MGVKIPVYSDQFGYHQINVWKTADNGLFQRTSQWLMPHLLINFSDLSESLGEVVAPAYDRQHHTWTTPTAYNYMGRPTSLFQYLRNEARERRIMVLTTATTSGRAYRFTINELRFKNNVSTAVKALTCRSFMDAIDVFIKLEQQQAADDDDSGIDVNYATDDATQAEYRQAIADQWCPLAEQGDANAQYTLGYLHEKGEVTEQNVHEAVKWYRKAARQNHLPAQIRLGSLYASGQGAPQNDVLAYFWFDLVARSGNRAAARLCRKLSGRMRPTQKAAAGQLARKWQAPPDAATAR